MKKPTFIATLSVLSVLVVGVLVYLTYAASDSKKVDNQLRASQESIKSRPKDTTMDTPAPNDETITPKEIEPADNRKPQPGKDSEPAEPIEPIQTVNPGPQSTPQEEALRQASVYRPKGMCTTVMTPARHIESGAVYTFTSGRIPSGWERISSGASAQL